jgi:hypothetical protein
MAIDTEKAHPLYAARIWQMGKSVVFPLYKAVMESIGAEPGDLVLVRVHGPYVTFRVAKPERVVPVDNLTAKELPPGSIPRSNMPADGKR